MCYPDNALKTVLKTQNGSILLNQNELIKLNEVWYSNRSEHDKNTKFFQCKFFIKYKNTQSQAKVTGRYQYPIFHGICFFYKTFSCF